MKKELYYQTQWPRDNFFVTCFVHELYNYRYHWHEAEYEIDILLKGKAEFCSGQNTYCLRENDVIFINPGIWHASFALEENSRALVLRFSDAAFKNFLKQDEQFRFSLSASDEQTRDSAIYRKLRYYAAMLLSSVERKEPVHQLTSRASFEMLLSSLCAAGFQAVKPADPQRKSRETIQRLIKFIEQHYAEKLSLEDIARYINYNRTYISTLFKNTIGINLHEYLTRVRLSNAIFQLAATEKNMTQIAVDCGFSDLKTFNHRFRDIFGYLPAEYRQKLNPACVIQGWDQLLVASDDPGVSEKLREYLSIL